MTLDRPTTTRTRRLLTVASVTVLGLALTTPTQGQARADVDLQPADFVPEEPIAIRVDALTPGKAGSDVAVTVANRTKRDVEAVVECTLADADREDLGVVTGEVVHVVAGGREKATVIGAEAAKYAECRVRDAR